MRIYVDGDLRREYSTKDTRLFGKVSAVAYVFLELQPEDAGKTLTLEVQTDSSYSGVFYKVYYGNRMGIWHYFFEKQGAEIIVAFFALILWLVSIVAGMILRVYYRKEIVLEYLGWGVFIAAVWLISNSVFRQLISPNLSVINDMAFLSLMILPLPLTIYMNGIQKRRYEKLYRMVCCVIILDFLVCTFLHMTKWVDYTDAVMYMTLVDTLAIVSMGVTIANDIRKGYVKEYLWVAIGILTSVVAAFVQMIMYFQRATAFSGSILALGLILLLVFATLNTIHEIFQMEQDKQKAMLSSEAKGKFLANMSHEIRTPINAVLGMNAMILRESRESQIKEYAMDIQNAGHTLLSLINDILDFSKIEMGKMELVLAEYDFSSMIHDIVNMISAKAATKGLELRICIDETIPSRLRGDDVRIRQIFVNLLNNAVKYTEKGTVTLKTDGRTEGDTLILTVQITDTGIGIKEEDMEKLFQEFERIEEKRNRNVEGSGLGMSITVRLLELMGSRLQVESVYGQGTTFSFELEQEIVDKEPVGNLEKRIREQAEGYTYHVTFTAPEARILVVDDNEMNRKVFVNLLKETQLQIEEAAGGMECLEKIQKTVYDIIFLDHMMPQMDGIETLQHIKEGGHLCEHTPVVALTANAISGAREQYLDAGFDDFVSKPVNPEKLEKLLIERLPEGKRTLHRTENAEERSKENVEFPAIDGIDWEYAFWHNKDTKILESTIKDFYALIDVEADALEALWNALEGEADIYDGQELLRQYRIKVHSMKSESALIGALSLSGVARMLEYAARDERVDVIKSVTPAFLEQWRSYKALLEPFAGKPDTDVPRRAGDMGMLAEYLNLLEAAMEDMDIDTADEIMKQLRSVSYPEAMTGVMDRLDVAVTNLSGEEVTECIKELRADLEGCL